LRRLGLALVALAGIAAAQAVGAEQASVTGWIAVDYGDIVDRREPTHSGESVGTVLDRLGGRPAPPSGERSALARDHDLLDPLLERYAHVLPDALDTVRGGELRRWIEIGWLWEPGEAAPAWVELLRARRVLVESDGRGAVRVFAPLEDAGTGPDTAAPPAERAWSAVRGWLRHVLAAERRSRAGEQLRVEVYAYRHRPARTLFELNLDPHVVEGDPLAPPADVPPLDLEALSRFLAGGMVVEGGRLEEGRLRLIGSEAVAAPTLSGEPVGLADLAAAYRAIAHGGRPSPYMSLDRGMSPHRSLVTYGGRLADTRLGLVSLLCDVRFKTFSQGIDPRSGDDVRDRVRRSVPGFETHIERFAAHPERGEDVGQQTRLWFYPDDVRMLVDPDGRMAAFARPRMTAASERVEVTGRASDRAQPPWTRALIEQINGSYDALAVPFPELAELDQVVRLLGLFTWLDFAREQGLAVPDLDALLAVELPALRTPRSFPQLLAFDAFPATPSDGPVDVFPRPEVSAALDRLMPEGGELPTRARLFRALASLDRTNPAHAALIEELSRVSPSELSQAELDGLAYRAERLRMHQLVIETLSREQRDLLRGREVGGDPVQVLSVAIGGLDLDLGAALRRGAGQSRPLGLGAGAVPRQTALAVEPGAGVPAAARPAPEEWRRESAGLPVARVPGIEETGAERRRLRSWVREDGTVREVGVVHLPLATDARARIVRVETDGETATIHRLEGGRAYRFGIAGAEGAYTVERAGDAPVSPSAVADRLAADPPPGLVTLAVSRAGRAVADGTGSTLVRLHARRPGMPPRAIDLSRTVVQALVLGPRLERGGARRALGELARLGGGAGADARTVMVMEDFARAGAPWEVDRYARPGEEDPRHLAWSITHAARESPGPDLRGVVGVDPNASPKRWTTAARSVRGALLWLPEAGFPAAVASLRDELAAAWPADRAVETLPEGELPGLVVLASAEPPGALAARVLELAGDPRMAGRHLAVLALSGSLRRDVASRALAEGGGIAAIGVAGTEPLAWRGVAREMRRLAAAVEGAGGEAMRPEELGGPFVWIY
jgi:hypothetical protein